VVSVAGVLVAAGQRRGHDETRLDRHRGEARAMASYRGVLGVDDATSTRH
jgi:hypothetical protein